MGAELTERDGASADDELRPYLLFAADRVFRVVLEALAHIDEWEPWAPFVRGYHVDLSPTFSLTVGARGLTRAEGEEIWRRLLRAPDLAAKLQFALWAAYFDGGGRPSTRVWTSLDSFLARLGYTRHPSGGYLPRDLRLVAQTLEAVVGLAVAGRWTDPKHRKDHTITGPLWQEGLVVMERRAGARERIWVAHQPGPWFVDSAWLAQNGFIGRVDAALLKLDTRRDRWAIRVGSAWAWRAKTNLQSGPVLKLRVRSLVDQTGASGQGRPGRAQGQIEAAHDRLVALGLISRWEWLPGPAAGWLAGSIRVEWSGSEAPLAAGTIPILTGSDTHPQWQRHPSSVAAGEIANPPNRSNGSKGRPLTLRAGAASSLSATRRPAREVVA
jgi:hypothetical protein